CGRRAKRLERAAEHFECAPVVKMDAPRFPATTMLQHAPAGDPRAEIVERVKENAIAIVQFVKWAQILSDRKLLVRQNALNPRPWNRARLRHRSMFYETVKPDRIEVAPVIQTAALRTSLAVFAHALR